MIDNEKTGPNLTSNQVRNIQMTGRTESAGTIIDPGQSEGKPALKKDLDFLLGIVIGIVVVTVVGFSIAIFTIQQDKSIYYKYMDNYVEQIRLNSEISAKMIDRIHNSDLKIEELKKELELLRAKNQYLR